MDFNAALSERRVKLWAQMHHHGPGLEPKQFLSIGRHRATVRQEHNKAAIKAAGLIHIVPQSIDYKCVNANRRMSANPITARGGWFRVARAPV